MSALVFPTTEYDENNSVLIQIPIAFIPAMRLGLQTLQQRDTWFDRSSWWRGYQVSAWIEEQLMSGNSLARLIEIQEATYRLLSTTFNGEKYTASVDPATQKTVVTPEIAAIPPDSTTAPNAMRAHIGRLMHQGENMTSGAQYAAGAGVDGAPALGDIALRATIRALQGILNPDWLGGGVPTTLTDVVQALKIGKGTQAAKINSALTTMLAEGANVATIFNAVRGLLADTISEGTEGAILGVLIASSLASAATAGAQGAQLDRIIRSLDGGAAAPPPDNLLYVLRGDVQPDAQNNMLRLTSQINRALRSDDDIKTAYAELNVLNQYIVLIRRYLYNVQGDPEPTQRELLQQIAGNAPGGGGVVDFTPVINKLEELRIELECICGNTGGGTTPPPPPNEENDPPLSAVPCLTAQAVRNDSWEQHGTKIINGTTYNVWLPVWTGYVDGSQYVEQYRSAAGYPMLRHGNGDQSGRQICVGWDFTGNSAIPVNVSVYQASQEAGANGPYDPLDIGLSLPAGGKSTDIPTGQSTQYIAYPFFFPQGTTPANNVFIQSNTLLA